MSNKITKQDVDEALRDIDTMVERIGSKVTERHDVDITEEFNYAVHIVRHGDKIFHVEGLTGYPYLHLTTGFDADAGLAASEIILAADDPDLHVQLTEEALENARAILKERRDETDLKTILREKLAGNGYKLDIKTEDDIAVVDVGDVGEEGDFTREDTMLFCAPQPPELR